MNLPAQNRRAFLQSTFASAATVPLLAAAATADASPRRASAVVEGSGAGAVSEAVFFAFDDHAIPWGDNLKLTPVTAEKHPANPVLRRGPPGAPDHGHAIL